MKKVWCCHQTRRIERRFRHKGYQIQVREGLFVCCSKSRLWHRYVVKISANCCWKDVWPSHSAITWAIASIRSFPLPISRLTCIKRAATEPNALKWYLILPCVVTWPWRIDSGRFLKAKPNWATKRLKIWEQWSEFLRRKRVLNLLGQGSGMLSLLLDAQ